MMGRGVSWRDPVAMHQKDGALLLEIAQDLPVVPRPLFLHRGRDGDGSHQVSGDLRAQGRSCFSCSRWAGRDLPGKIRGAN